MVHGQHRRPFMKDFRAFYCCHSHIHFVVTQTGDVMPESAIVSQEKIEQITEIWNERHPNKEFHPHNPLNMDEIINVN